MFYNPKNANFLIAGGNGFIGKNLALALRQKYPNCGIRIIDNFSSSDPPDEAWKRIFENLRIRVLEGDISKNTFFGDPWSPPDYIFNLACMASPEYYLSDPLKTLEDCFVGTSNILAHASKVNKPIVIHASTSEIYGSSEDESFVEGKCWGNVDPWCYRSSYDEGKRVAETLCYTYKNTKNLDVRVARIFNTYGPFMNQNDGRVVTQFLKKMFNDEPVEFYGSGSIVRSFCYVDDLVRGLVKLATVKETPAHPVNLGNPNPTTLASLFEKIAALYSEYVREAVKSPTTLDFRPNDPKYRKPCIAASGKFLGWEPSVSLEEGLRKTFQYFLEVEVLGKSPSYTIEDLYVNKASILG